MTRPVTGLESSWCGVSRALAELDASLTGSKRVDGARKWWRWGVGRGDEQYQLMIRLSERLSVDAPPSSLAAIRLPRRARAKV